MEVTNNFVDVMKDIMQEEGLDGPKFAQAVGETFEGIDQLATQAEITLREDTKKQLAEQFEHLASKMAKCSSALNDFATTKKSLASKRVDEYKAYHQPDIDSDRTLWQNFLHNKPLRAKDSQEKREESMQIIPRAGLCVLIQLTKENAWIHRQIDVVSGNGSTNDGDKILIGNFYGV